MLLSQQGFYFWVSFKRDYLFLENNETTSYFFWRRKRSKKTLFPYFLAQKEAKTSTPSRPSPILEGSTQENAETAIFLPCR